MLLSMLSLHSMNLPMSLSLPLKAILPFVLAGWCSSLMFPPALSVPTPGDVMAMVSMSMLWILPLSVAHASSSCSSKMPRLSYTCGVTTLARSAFLMSACSVAVKRSFFGVMSDLNGIVLWPQMREPLRLFISNLCSCSASLSLVKCTAASVMATPSGCSRVRLVMFALMSLSAV